MLENLFTGAARDLRNNGWTQPAGDNALLFYHSEFGTHEFFKACYIHCNAERIRRHRKYRSTAMFVGVVLLLSAAVIFTLSKIGILCEI